ncbi:MAG TPA: hypothetical protein VF841_02720 [Anaeromyxobacter sp.]
MTSPAVTFRLDPRSGELVVLDASGAESWRGLPGGRKARAIDVSGSRCVVLLEPDPATKNDENLIRVDGSGREIWRARPPDRSGPDCWVSAHVDGDRVTASSWSGWRVVLDAESGALRESTFAK